MRWCPLMRAYHALLRQGIKYDRHRPLRLLLDDFVPETDNDFSRYVRAAFETAEEQRAVQQFLLDPVTSDLCFQQVTKQVVRHHRDTWLSSHSKKLPLSLEGTDTTSTMDHSSLSRCLKALRILNNGQEMMHFIEYDQQFWQSVPPNTIESEVIGRQTPVINAAIEKDPSVEPKVDVACHYTKLAGLAESTQKAIEYLVKSMKHYPTAHASAHLAHYCRLKGKEILIIRARNPQSQDDSDGSDYSGGVRPSSSSSSSSSSFLDLTADKSTNMDDDGSHHSDSEEKKESFSLQSKSALLDDSDSSFSSSSNQPNPLQIISHEDGIELSKHYSLMAIDLDPGLGDGYREYACSLMSEHNHFAKGQDEYTTMVSESVNDLLIKAATSERCSNREGCLELLSAAHSMKQDHCAALRFTVAALHFYFHSLDPHSGLDDESREQLLSKLRRTVRMVRNGFRPFVSELMMKH